MSSKDRLYTVAEAARDYFQGKLSPREITRLWHAGELTGFRGGAGRGRILLYESGLDHYRHSRENKKPPAPQGTQGAQLPHAEGRAASPQPGKRRARAPVPHVPLRRLPRSPKT